MDLVAPDRCKYVLHTVKGSVRPQPPMTVLCAGAERGGKDACQVEKALIQLKCVIMVDDPEPSSVPRRFRPISV